MRPYNRTFPKRGTPSRRLQRSKIAAYDWLHDIAIAGVKNRFPLCNSVTNRPGNQCMNRRARIGRALHIPDICICKHLDRSLGRYMMIQQNSAQKCDAGYRLSMSLPGNHRDMGGIFLVKSRNGTTRASTQLHRTRKQIHNER